MSASPRIAAASARQWIEEVLLTREMDAADAGLVADALVDSSLRGVDTHGIALFPGYFKQLTAGATKARPEIAIAEHGAMLRVDADCGLGQVVVSRVMDHAVALARRHGLAGAMISQVGHLGALGYFARRASEAGMIALVLQNGPPLMGLPGSTARAIGNNPLAFGVPVVGGPAIVFDAATSEVAFGKLIAARQTGASLPGDVALDRAGQPTTDPAAAMDGILLPAGGPQGVAIAMLIEVLAGSLTGTRPVWGGPIFGAFLLVVDPFVGDETFNLHIADWLRHYAASAADARYPGQRAQAVFEQRSREGIEMPERLRGDLVDVGEQAGTPFPPL